MNSLIKKTDGFSLIELFVVMGILTITGLGISSLMQNLSKSQNTIDFSSDLTTLKTISTMALSNSGCRVNFGLPGTYQLSLKKLAPGTVYNPDDPSTFQTLPAGQGIFYPKESPAGSGNWTRGDSILSLNSTVTEGNPRGRYGNLQVADIRFTNLHGDFLSGVVLGELRIVAQRYADPNSKYGQKNHSQATSYGNRIKEAVIPISFKVNEKGLVLDCDITGSETDTPPATGGTSGYPKVDLYETAMAKGGDLTNAVFLQCEFPYAVNSFEISQGNNLSFYYMAGMRPLCGNVNDATTLYRTIRPINPERRTPHWFGCDKCDLHIHSTGAVCPANQNLIGLEVGTITGGITSTGGPVTSLKPVCGDSKTGTGTPLGDWTGKSSGGWDAYMKTNRVTCKAGYRVVGLTALNDDDHVYDVGLICLKVE